MPLLVCLLGLMSSSGVERPDAPAPRAGASIGVRLDPGSYHVGQGIAVLVTTPPGEEVSVPVQPPAIDGAELVATASRAPGTAQFWLILKRAGSLTIPPFRTKHGDRGFASKPVTIHVATIPASGRTPAFLGGVGPFDLTTRVDPPVVRLGQVLEYRIELTGPAVWGTQQVPVLALPAAFQAREVSAERTQTDPPSRTFRYRLRAVQPGRIVLPPVAVASFDPRSGHFLTRSAPSQVVRIESPPPFDPATVDFRPIRPSGTKPSRLILSILTGLGGVVLVGFLWWNRQVYRRWTLHRRAHRRVNWQYEANRFARWAQVEWHGSETVGEVVVDRLTNLIERSSGQSIAVLTPSDARIAIMGMTHDEPIANRTHQLVAACDQMRFDPIADPTVGDLEELVAEAVAVFRAIGETGKINRSQHVRNKFFRLRNQH